jgi:twitching motility protein PilT
LTPEIMQHVVEELLTPEQRTQLEQNRELLTGFTFPNSARFRMHFYYSKGYAAVSMRLIPNRIPTLEELRLPGSVAKFAEFRQGLMLVAGPYGSGRTTTLASIVQEINVRRSERILTIERPIEYLFINEKSLVSQQEVGRDTPNMTRALTSAMEEDVNVIMLSELDAPDVIELALRAANTGRYVLTAVSRPSSVKAIQKLIDAFPDERQDEAKTMIADTLIGVVAQHLLPRVGGGVVPIVEVLTMTPAAQSIIREGRIEQLQSVLETSREEGMFSLDRSLLAYAQSGDIQAEDAIGAAEDPQNLRMLLRARA